MRKLEKIATLALTLLAVELVIAFLSRTAYTNVLSIYLTNLFTFAPFKLVIADIVVAFTIFTLRKNQEVISTDPSIYLNHVQWTSMHLAVYAATENPYYLYLIKTAMDKWNNTGATSLFLTNDKTNANIIVNVLNNMSDDIAAQTINGNPKTGEIFNQIQIQINSKQIYQSMTEQYFALVTIEHEFGHALGLNHRTGRSVMNNQELHEITKLDAQAISNRKIA